MKAKFCFGSDGIYCCPELSALGWLQHGFGSSHGSPEASITLRQIHSAQVWNAEGLTDREREGDALVTGALNLSIGVRTADCVPILLADPETHAVAAIHAGWRGTAQNIVRAALHRLRACYGTEPASVLAAIGPCIRPCCYEVGAEVASQFAGLFPEWSAGTGQRYIDLAEANSRQLTGAGVLATHVYDCNLCTACSQEPLFSYRRAPDNPGRMLTAITRLT